MSDTTRPRDVSFEVDGKSFTLRLGFNEFARLQEAWGISMSSDFWKLLELTRNPWHWRGLFHAALSTHHPEMTVEATGLLMDALGFQRFQAVMAEAFLWTNADEPGQGAAWAQTTSTSSRPS